MALQVWELTFAKEELKRIIKSIAVLGDLDIWKETNNTMEVMVDGFRAGTVAGILHEKEITFTIAVPDVYALYAKELTDPSHHRITPGSKMDWHSYHRLETIYNFMDDLANEYPYICSVFTIGYTVEGRPLKMLKISDGHEGNRGVWLDGTIHAREWITAAVVTYIANQIVKHFNTLPSTVTNKDWYILPVLNPDGYEYSHTTDRMWRKNRSKFGDNYGVDLNRNWSYGWGVTGEDGSSKDPRSIFYRGPKPFSEKETAAVKNIILRAERPFEVFVSYHSYSEAIIFPWGYSPDPCPDYVTLLEAGTAMSRAINNTYGQTYKVGSTKDLLYYAAGTSIDWSYGNAHIPYSYMVELRSLTHRFLLPKEQIIPTASEQFNGILRLLEFIEEYRQKTNTDSFSSSEIDEIRNLQNSKN